VQSFAYPQPSPVPTCLTYGRPASPEELADPSTPTVGAFNRSGPLYCSGIEKLSPAAPAHSDTRFLE